MKERLIGFLRTYFLFVCIFALQKPFFMCYYRSFYADASLADWLSVIWHGLPLDLSLAGYFTVIPGVLFIVSSWTTSEALRKIWCGYYFFISILLALIFCVDLGLYQYWGFRLDATPLFYFFSSPKDAVASVSIWMVIGGVVIMMAYAALLYGIFYVSLVRKTAKLPFYSLHTSVVMLLITGVLFIPIRGGFTASTMNVGKVYFSTNQRLNHAAINPVFSFVYSLSKQNDFGNQYRFMEAEEADRIFSKLLDPEVLAKASGQTDSLKAVPINSLFTIQRPNIVVVILESFSSKLMKTLGGEAPVAVNLDSLTQEGILFTNFYANSFRTDRGLVSILSGYPAQPTTSIMKYPRKTQSMPSIAGSLKKAGYDAKYYYGGDADFTNMRSFLISSGYEDIICDKDFDTSERLSKWGVHDHLVFDRFLKDLKNDFATNISSKDTPRFRVLQTSSSHEPFDVPYHRLKDDHLNAFAYADSCVGDFVKRFRVLPQWKNTVIIFVPDHLGAYPEHITNMDIADYQVPLLIIGGAVRAPKRIDTYGSQQDIAATLLAQLRLPHGDFTFSKDMLNPASPHFAFFSAPDVFGMVNADNKLIFNNEANVVVVDEGTKKSRNLPLGQAYLQKLYDDIAKK